MADYHFAVQRFDLDLARALRKLEALGELEKTIVVVTGDVFDEYPYFEGTNLHPDRRVPRQRPATLDPAGLGRAHQRRLNAWCTRRGLLSLTVEHERTRTIGGLRKRWLSMGGVRMNMNLKELFKTTTRHTL